MAQPSSSTFHLKAFLTSGSGARSVPCARDAVVYRQGAIADAVYYLQQGRIKISVASSEGKEAIIGILDVGTFFGEGCLIGNTSRPASAVAMVDSEVIRVSKADMLRLLREETMFGQFFMEHLLARNSRIEEDLVDQLFHSSEKRLARALILLANAQKDGGRYPIALKVNQETLAELVGTTRPRVSHFMTKFRKLGFISYQDGLQVHSSLLSAVLREAPETEKQAAGFEGRTGRPPDIAVSGPTSEASPMPGGPVGGFRVSPAEINKPCAALQPPELPAPQLPPPTGPPAAGGNRAGP